MIPINTPDSTRSGTHQFLPAPGTSQLLSMICTSAMFEFNKLLHFVLQDKAAALVNKRK